MTYIIKIIGATRNFVYDTMIHPSQYTIHSTSVGTFIMKVQSSQYEY